MKLRAIRAKAFSATILVPAATPDGTSLEEKLDAFLQVDSEGTERTLVSLSFQLEGTAYTALLLYTSE